MPYSLKCDNCTGHLNCGSNPNGCGGPHVPHGFSYPIIPSKESSEKIYDDYFGNRDNFDVGVYAGHREGYVNLHGEMVRGRSFT